MIRALKIEIKIAKQEILGTTENVSTKVIWGHLIWPRKVNWNSWWQLNSKNVQKFGNDPISKMFEKI